MGATTTYTWPYPNLGDPANGPAAFQAGLQAVENTVKDTTVSTYTPSWFSTGGAGIQPTSPSILNGRYRVDHGLCYFAINLFADGTTGGGSGDLWLTLPLPSGNHGLQLADAKLYCPASGGGTYRGTVDIGANTSNMSLYFPASATDVRMSPWRNTDATAASGTGIPLVPSSYPIVNGSFVLVKGHYFL